MRPVAPGAVIFANIGAVSLNYGIGIDEVRRLVADLRADGLFLHLNPLQEALQPAGDTNFRGLHRQDRGPVRGARRAGRRQERRLGDRRDDRRAAARRRGRRASTPPRPAGTSWARVEGKRAGDVRREALAETFAGWGQPTAEAVRALRARFPGIPLIASGGVRTGVDIAKAMALGADMCGLALPFLVAAERSQAAVDDLIAALTDGLRIAMFATGSARPAGLRRALVP